MIVKAVTRRSNASEDLNGGESNHAVGQYKEVIRVQGKKVNELTSENEALKEEMQLYAADVDQLRQQVYELQQQNTELRLRVSRVKF
jgi:polyhydroxyalkanoate synthesis regulator phasin